MEKSIPFLPAYWLLLAAVFLCTSCGESGGNRSQAGNNLKMDTISVVSRHHLEGDTTNPYCDIKVEFIYPLSSQKTSLDTLQQFFVTAVFGTAYATLKPDAAVKAYIRNFVDHYTHDAGTYRETARELDELNALIPEIDHADNEQVGKDRFYSYYESISDSIAFNQQGLLSFQVKQSNNKGGATSYQLCRNYVFNLRAGAQVTENDLFHAGYDTALQNIIIASLLEENGVKSIEELEELGFFGIREILPNRNFLLNEEGIIYTFNKGEYSAYQLDAPEIMIPYRSIRSLLRENSIASKLADLK
ncbi:MAG: RsiV family protein [Proteiniphilum sp.]|nr:RsiV family protein [Proteiniphilum sp.]MDD4158349.1 RsiV family protein [Proteiniphilum sp.]MDD4799427.1 RsiV family protein [Proteiniphilum sp.]